jgi:hypothetical protein
MYMHTENIKLRVEEHDWDLLSHGTSKYLDALQHDVRDHILKSFSIPFFLLYIPHLRAQSPISALKIAQCLSG